MILIKVILWYGKKFQQLQLFFENVNCRKLIPMFDLPLRFPSKNVYSFSIMPIFFVQTQYWNYIRWFIVLSWIDLIFNNIILRIFHKIIFKKII